MILSCTKTELIERWRARADSFRKFREGLKRDSAPYRRYSAKIEAIELCISDLEMWQEVKTKGKI